MVLASDGPFPSASTAHIYTTRQASTWHWYYSLSLATRLRLLLNGRAQTEPWQCQLQKQTVFLFSPSSSRCLVASGQRSSRNRDHKHSACFISRYYKAFTCRIIGQKVQRVPVLMGGRGGNRCLFVDNLVHRPLTSISHPQSIQLPVRQKNVQNRHFLVHRI